MNKKIIFLNSSLTDGGSERVMAMLANYCAKSGLDTTMVLLREKKKTYQVDESVNCLQLEYGSKNKILIAFKRFWMVRNILKKTGAGIVVSFMWDINLFTILVCTGLNTKIFVSERCHPLMNGGGILQRWGEQLLYPKASKIVLQTYEVKEYYSSRIKEKSIVIPNPINPNLTETYKEDRTKEIVAVGRLTPQKNFQMLIDAFSSFLPKHPDYKLIIYGEGPLLHSLTNQVKQLKIEDFVTFAGYVKDVDVRIRSAAMYISTSEFEGISNSMLEALAMGIPTICTDCPVGGAAMMIEQNKSGILIPVGDTDALTREMSKIADNPDFAHYLSGNAATLRNKYSIDKIGKLWIDLFNSREE